MEMEYIIEMLGITKEFSGFKANDNITLQLRKGEIHALLGENGAGKSTLMSILFGLYTPDKGVIKIHGEDTRIANPNDANKYGIGMVHQHFKLVHNFTVLENIVLGIETVRGGFVRMEEARERVVQLSEKYNMMIEPDAHISDITVGMQQRVEILKMLYRNNDILIFDEPTAVLIPQEIDELMNIMTNLKDEGKSIIFITHKLNEIKQVADRCSVLRKGKYIGTVDVADVTKEDMSEMMVGHKVCFKIEKDNKDVGDVVLEVKGLNLKSKHTGKHLLKDINFSVKSGEVVCISGIDGNGQSELVYAITGLMEADAGDILLNGENISRYSIRKRNTRGLGHIPEDRHKHGLVLEYNMAQNLMLKKYFKEDFQSLGFIKFREMYKFADEMIEKFDIRSSGGSYSEARGMSGGNQQKVIIAREIDTDPDILIAVQPTRGLDVGAIEYIHKQIVDQRNKGRAVLLVSLELDEVLNLSDRILVMCEGEIVADVFPADVSSQELGLYMAGSKRGG